MKGKAVIAIEGLGVPAPNQDLAGPLRRALSEYNLTSAVVGSLQEEVDPSVDIVITDSRLCVGYENRVALSLSADAARTPSSTRLERALRIDI